MRLTEHLTAGPALGLAGLLDLPTDEIGDGWQLPPLWHWVYLLERPAQRDLGPEGHPVHGIPSPPRPGLRRMYAGGRVTTHRSLRLGGEATSTLEVTAARERTGRSGWMSIVTTTRTVTQDGAVAITDETDIIYREPTPLRAGAVPEEPSAGPQETCQVTVDETLLFRFSALTFNGHRIHYDVDYCRKEEDYAGLVVHGPLQALLMAQYAYETPGFRAPDAPSTFAYRLVSPLTLGQGLVIGRQAADGAVTTAVRDAGGRQTATGKLAHA